MRIGPRADLPEVHRRVLLRVTALAGAAVLAALTSMAGPQGAALAQEAEEQAGSAFYAIGAAEGVRFGVVSRGFLVVEQFADAGMPAAQALTSSIDSSGFAAAPYPGDETYGVLGTVSGASGQDVSNPPVSVRTNSANPEEEKSLGTYVLRSKTDASSTVASAAGSAGADGGAVGTSEASASSLHKPDGTSVATSVSRAESIVIGDVLRIGGVVATAEVTAPIGKQPVRTSELKVSEVRVVGQAVAVTEKGLVLAGTTTPIPRDSGLEKALADQGITLIYLAATETPDGVISAGLRVEQKRQFPELPEPVVVSYTFGRAAAFAQGGESAAVTDVVAPPVSIDDVFTESPAFDGPVPDAFAGSTGSDLPAIDSGSGPLPAAEPVVGEATAPVAAPASRALIASSSRGPLSSDAAYFYLVLVVGGVLLVGGVQLLRLFGVKVLWT
jgi:hypothetical protein